MKIKFLHSKARSTRMLSIKMRDLKGMKNDIFNEQAVARSSRPEVFYKKRFLSYFEKFTGKQRCRSLFASLTLLRKTPALEVFFKFCNILKSTSFLKQIRPAASEHSQNHKKWYSDMKIGISVVHPHLPWRKPLTSFLCFYC